MDVIIYKKVDGGVALGMFCNAQGRPMCNPEIEGAEVVAANPDFISFRVGSSANLPGGNADGSYDRYFRDAFTDDNTGPSVNIDMAKAHGVQLARIRAARDVKLVALDVEQLRGSDVDAEKQVLRDLPDTLDFTAANTPARLKAFWPSELD